MGTCIKVNCIFRRLYMKVMISVLSMVFLLACSPKQESQVTEEVTIENYYLISALEFRSKMGETGIVILDVRTQGEVANGFIPGAVHIDFQQADFLKNIAALDKEKAYMVYCRLGGRSGKSRKLMNQHGFSEVFDLDGGITAWQDAGYSLVNE